MDLILDKWDEILEKVRKEHELSDVSFKTWLQPLKVYNVENDTIIILVPSEQMGLNYISKKYILPLKVAVAELIGKDYELEFILPEQAKEKERNKPSSVVPKTNESVERANLNPKYTFETFVVGSNNSFANAASLAVAESPGEIYNPLFL